ncbi:acyl-CoA dehydrogenase [Neorhizobium lilium]|uniref:Acyl-CoA dehydrogenase n=1 Tax=Neorhizobium lilium TaxID=2503024 RepID=A0A444LM11_9HYPH|nr:acyl-CoA dehydrogenase family protein [Neorhizobium lilium]RWX81312.1 acyl-CoA dehydrogenase [Neorhizobium lilium]
MNTHNRSSAILTEALLRSLTDEFAATAARHDADASFPFENFKRLTEHKLIALTVPTTLGGLGGGLVDSARLVSAVGAGEASTGLLIAMNCMMHYLLGRNPSPAYEEIANAALKGTGVLNALQAEPDLGSAVRGGLPGTVVSQQPDGSFRLNGRKAYATGSPIVGWWLTLIRTDEDHPRIGTVLVPANSPGLEIVPTWNHAGLRATASHEIRFNDVHLPESASTGLLPAGSPELISRRAVIDVWSCILTASLYDGIAKAGRDWLLGFLRERTPSNLGAPLATVPRLQGVVGEIEALLLINRVLIDNAVRAADAAPVHDPVHAQMVKHIVTNNAVKALELALSISGNHGLDRANPLERHYRDALCGRVHAPQSDTILVNAGKASLFA